jgi:hypothetical protein
VTLPLTPDTLCAAYEYLRATPPFRRWKLPQGDQIEFRVTHEKSYVGQAIGGAEFPIIWISGHHVGRTQTLLETMAHEMIHVYLDRKGVRAHHGAAFKSCADRICRYHGFDPRGF